MQSKHDLEHDLHHSDLILEKIKEDRYAQNLYAAMCNMQWQYLGSEWALEAGDLAALALADTWSCSWRYSGGIVAELQGQGDYMSWYCSGIGFIPDSGFVNEGTVTDEIRADLASMGWHPVPWDDDNDLS